MTENAAGSAWTRASTPSPDAPLPSPSPTPHTPALSIFPNTDACLRLVRALAVETRENWLEAHRYLNMNDLRELKKTHLRQAA